MSDYMEDIIRLVSNPDLSTRAVVTLLCGVGILDGRMEGISISTFSTVETFPQKLGKAIAARHDFDEIQKFDIKQWMRWDCDSLVIARYFDVILWAKFRNDYWASHERKSRLENHLGAYHYIPLSTKSFVEIMNIHHLRMGRAFVDIGCGIGEKVWIAERMGFQKVYGVELNKYTAKIARKHFKRGAIIEANAIDIDYSRFGPAFFYTWNIMAGDRGLTRMHKRLVSTMVPGSIVYEAGPSTLLFEAAGVVPEKAKKDREGRRFLYKHWETGELQEDFVEFRE